MPYFREVSASLLVSPPLKVIRDVYLYLLDPLLSVPFRHIFFAAHYGHRRRPALAF